MDAGARYRPMDPNESEDEAENLVFDETWYNQTIIRVGAFGHPPVEALRNMRYHRSRVSRDGLKTIRFEFLRDEMMYGRRSPGQSCTTWMQSNIPVNGRIIRSIDLHDFEGVHHSFIRMCNQWRLRILVMIDDIYLHKHTAFYHSHLCGYCKLVGSHFTWTCPLYYREDLRLALLREEGVCVGCGNSNCQIRAKTHHANITNCPNCRDGSQTTHVSWRCWSPHRLTQVLSTTCRYVSFWRATYEWSDRELEDLLKEMCERFDLPFLQVPGTRDRLPHALNNNIRVRRNTNAR